MNLCSTVGRMSFNAVNNHSSSSLHLSGTVKKVVLVGCGCFNPPTIMHQRMFEIGRDHLHSLKNQPHRVLGAVLSPTHDLYGKCGLLPSTHRNAMAKLALKGDTFLRVSTWETEQEQWSRTRVVLDTYRKQIRDFATGLTDKKPEWVPPEATKEDLEDAGLYLLCGEDLLESFNSPGVWSEEDIMAIVRDHGLVVLSRGEMTAQELIYKSDVLHKHKENIHLAVSDMGTDISSTKIRLAVRRNRSIRYLVADEVIAYIQDHNLYSQFEYYQTTDNHVPALEQEDPQTLLSLTSPYLMPQRKTPLDSSSPHALPPLQMHVKASQCDLRSVVDPIPMIDDHTSPEDVGYRLLQDLSLGNGDRSEEAQSSCKSRHSPKKGKGKKIPNARAKSESSLQIELSAKGVTITGERESFL